MRSDQVQNTRYNKGGITYTSGNKVGWWERISIPQTSNDLTITLGPEYHLQPFKLAYDLYGKANLMWIILQHNNILDITTEFVTGSVVVVPTKDRVFQEILSTTPKSTNIII